MKGRIDTPEQRWRNASITIIKNKTPGNHHRITITLTDKADRYYHLQLRPQQAVEFINELADVLEQ